MNYSLIIPIYNESKTLNKLLETLNNLDEKIEIIIVDDGSTDDTKKILEVNSNNNIKIINNNYNLGKGSAINVGLKVASNQNIILFDGDLELDTRDIPHLISIYESEECDALVGKRWRNKNASNFNINSIGNNIFNYIFNKFFSTKLNDVLCCVKILKTSLYQSLDIQSVGFNIEIEIMSKLAIKKSIIKEHKISYTPRTVSEGKKIKIIDGWSILWTMVKTRYLFRP
tara:strand:+ start:445 stop:1128 length:684 start_codon:yes stop_codon:yes gene_type:complete